MLKKVDSYFNLIDGCDDACEVGDDNYNEDDCAKCCGKLCELNAEDCDTCCKDFRGKIFDINFAGQN